MKPERLSLEDLIQRHTVLQPPPNRFTLYAWREALGLASEDARESQEHAFWFFHEVQKFLADPRREHRGINRLLLQSKRAPEPVTEETIEACRAWLGAHALKVEREILPAQGFGQVYGLGTPESPTGGCRVWERGEERLFVNDERSGWAYTLTLMGPEEWAEFKTGVEVDDRFALLCDLIKVLNALAGPDLPEEERLTQEDIDPGEGMYETGYPPLPEYLQTFREDLAEVLTSPIGTALLDALQGLEWEDLAEALALAKQRLGDKWEMYQ